MGREHPWLLGVLQLGIWAELQLQPVPVPRHVRSFYIISYEVDRELFISSRIAELSPLPRPLDGAQLTERSQRLLEPGRVC